MVAVFKSFKYLSHGNGFGLLFASKNLNQLMCVFGGGEGGVLRGDVFFC